MSRSLFDGPDVDLDVVLAKRYAVGKGVLLLSSSLSSEHVGRTVRHAAKLSNGKPFVVVPIGPSGDLG